MFCQPKMCVCVGEQTICGEPPRIFDVWRSPDRIGAYALSGYFAFVFTEHDVMNFVISVSVGVTAADDFMICAFLVFVVRIAIEYSVHTVMLM